MRAAYPASRPPQDSCYVKLDMAASKPANMDDAAEGDRPDAVGDSVEDRLPGACDCCSRRCSMTAREPLRWAEASADAQLHVNAFFDESRRATKARLTRSHA